MRPISCDSMTLNYRYHQIYGKGRPMRRPMISVSFSNGSNVFKTMALLDSGADVSAISSDIAELIGLDTVGPKSVSHGVAGKVESIEKRVNISFGKDHETYKFTIPVKILFVDESDSPSFVPLLGRDGFFSEFKISFDEANSKFSLKRNDNQ